MTEATLARIEDYLRRIADALEHPRTDRLPELVDIAQRGLDRVAASFRPTGSPDGSRLAMQDLAMELRAALDAKPCDDRTCTDRDHWAPIARINHGSTPTTCIHGQDHPDALTCEYRCAATMRGHWCTRREHADDRHVWAMSDQEAERHLRLEAEADPLDESDPEPYPIASARDGWHQIDCPAPGCTWSTTGLEAICESAWHEHKAEAHASTPDEDAATEAENGATD